MIFGESSVVSACGALAGLLMGTALLFALKIVPALHGYVDASLRPSVMILVLFLAQLTGIAGALYPAIYAMRIRAVEALRFE
jgi:putative ABC transport system permease protein